MVESQRSAAQDERRQRVERVRSETTDTVTRNAKKAYVDERWDIADTMREKAETFRAARKAQELAYLESALAINAATSMEPAKAARAKAQESKLKASTLARERKKALKDQAVADDASYGQAKSAIHDSIHGLKFVPDDEVRGRSPDWGTAGVASLAPAPHRPSSLSLSLSLSLPTHSLAHSRMCMFLGAIQVKSLAKTDTSRFKTFFAPRTPTSSRRKAPYEVIL